MLKRLKAAGAVLLLALAAAGLVRLRERMPAADVIRKLAGLRVAVTFYRMEYKTPPASFGQVLAAGKLETVPGSNWPGTRARRKSRTSLPSGSGTPAAGLT